MCEDESNPKGKRRGSARKAAEIPGGRQPKVPPFIFTGPTNTERTQNMFKKSLIALVTLSAAAVAANAADITLSGRIDAGLNYHHEKVTGEKSDGTFSMKSGQYSASRFTLKGSEELGNGTSVGFILENGFDSDTGAFSQEGKIFGREAIVYVKGEFGTFAMGRVGALASGAGSFSRIYDYAAFGTGWGDYAGAKGAFMLGDRDRFDNSITYVSPEFAGLTVSAQYSLKTAGAEADHSSLNKRYAALGATYNLGAFSTGLVVDTIMNGAKDDSYNTEDSLGVSWGASFDLGVTKPMVLVQYGKNENKLGGFNFAQMLKDYGDEDHPYAASRNGGLKGYAVALGAVTPILGGNLYTAVNYTDGELDGRAYGVDFTDDKRGDELGYATADVKRWGFAAGYDYPLSKRTKVYGFAAYNQGEAKASLYDMKGQPGNSGKFREKDTEVGFGMVHFF